MAFPLIAAVIERLADEERYLAAYLPGYEAYCRQIKHQLASTVGSVAAVRNPSVACFRVRRVMHEF